MWTSQLPAPPCTLPWVPKPTRLLPNKAKYALCGISAHSLGAQFGREVPWCKAWKGPPALYSGSFHLHSYHATSSWGGPRALPASFMDWQLHGSPMAGWGTSCPPTGPSCSAHHRPLRCQCWQVTFSSTSCCPDTAYDMNIAKARTCFFHTKIKNHVRLTYNL